MAAFEQQLAASKLIGMLLKIKEWSDLQCLFTYFHHWSIRFSAADTILSKFIGLPWWIFPLGRACRTYMSVVSLHFSSQLFQLHRNVSWMQERGCQRRSAKWLLIKQLNPINLWAKPRTLSHLSNKSAIHCWSRHLNTITLVESCSATGRVMETSSGAWVLDSEDLEWNLGCRAVRATLVLCYQGSVLLPLLAFCLFSMFTFYSLSFSSAGCCSCFPLLYLSRSLWIKCVSIKTRIPCSLHAPSNLTVSFCLSTCLAVSYKPPPGVTSAFPICQMNHN